MRQRPILIVVGRQRPHNILLLAYGLALGLGVLFGQIPQPPDEALSTPFAALWKFGLIASGVLGLVGAYWWGEVRRGLMLDRSAMLIGAGSVLALAYTIIDAYGSRAGLTIGFCVAWGIADLVRAGQISKDLRSLGGKKKEDAGGPGQHGGVSGRRPYRWGTDRSDSGFGSTSPREGRHNRHLE